MKPKPYYAEPLAVPRSRIESEERFRMNVVSDQRELWQRLAEDLCETIAQNQTAGLATRVILSPRWLQLEPLAHEINARKIDCQRLTVFHPEEFCGKDGRLVPPEHPLSLRGRAWRELYGLLERRLRPASENIDFPDPARPGEFGARFSDAGGAQICYITPGIDAHLGFHTGFHTDLDGRPKVNQERDDSYFETREGTFTLTPQAINEAAAEFGVEPALVPPMAVCAALTDVMRSAEIRLFLGYPWQSAVLRRVLYGPVDACYPASILQRHPEVQVTMVPEVAELPGIL